MSSLYIALNYIRRHIVKFLLISLALGTIISSVIFTQIFVDAQKFSAFFSSRQQILPFKAVLCDVPPELITDELLKEYSAGRQYINGYIEIDSQKYYIGHSDKSALSSMNTVILRGRMPENENELAMSEGDLNLLGVQIGDKLKLTVTDKSGTHEREYLVCGMTSDFYQKFNETEVYIPQQSKDDFDSSVIKIPAFISGKSENFISLNMVIDVMDYYNYPDGHPITISQKATIISSEQEIANISTQPEPQEEKEYFIILFVIPAILITAAFAGVYTAVKILADGQKNNIGFIKTIGGTKSQIFLSFFFEALFISLLASVMSAIVGYAICFAFSQTLRELGAVYDMPLHLVLIISLISFIILLLFYMVYFFIIYRDRKFKIYAYRKEKRSINKVWAKTVDTNSGSSRVAFCIVISLSILIFSAGCLWGDFSVIDYASDIENSKRYENDYITCIGGGTISSELMYYAIPSNCGLSQDEIQKLYTDYPLKENARAMFQSLQVYLDLRGMDGLSRLNRVSIPDHLIDDFRESGIKNPTMLNKYNLKGIPYEYLNFFINDVDFSKEDYDKGKIAISMNGKFEANTTLKASFVKFPKEIIDVYYTDKIYELVPEIYTVDIDITHTKTLSDKSHAEEIQDLIKKGETCIILSDAYLLSICDDFRYDYIIANNSREISDSEAFEIDEFIASSANSNDLLFINNYIYPMLMKREAEKARVPYIAMSLIYMTVIVFFAYICINSEVRSKEKIFSILKSVGIEKFKLIKLICYSSVRKIFPGIILGAVLYAAFYSVLYFRVSKFGISDYFPLFEAAVYPLIIIAVIVGIVLIASVISAIWVKNKERQNIE